MENVYNTGTKKGSIMK